MPWLKQGDAAANHPIVLAAVEMDDADDRILNECFGFVARCATQAAAYEQDYIISVGTARQMAGSLGRYNELIKAAKFCGYLSETKIIVDGEERKAFKLVEDNDLFHMILKAEREWTNQRKRDTRNPELTWRVRARDGDACRYCGKTVAWGDTKSGRGATYDHTNPGHAGTVDTLVVCCRECNGRRQDDPESNWKTLPVPAEPLTGEATAAFIAKHGTPIEPTYTRPGTPAVTTTATDETQAVEQPKQAAPAQSEATAPSGPDSDSTTHTATVRHSPAATAHPAATAPKTNTRPNPDPGHRYPGSGYVGTGRDGTGQAGKGSAGQEAPHTSQGKPKNQTRRRRPRNRGRN
ncbi:hypothetical protein RI444_15350 [Paenarthrobacter sp. AT5]|uniref:HNH endonuclease n=1 Tax=Paenarthrobacter TaxID=1742992 RepID=UPI001A9867CF|nr:MULTISPECIES: HNH endonuclease signature motif containing protein [Paenarthrobacter]QSZ53291.1 hypothetical protein AYX19_09920 [Paenarthrobacter ureafaciens]WOC59883.1 hypothetical protein RI444_15350 [Paenarthrobacter sp. AT5]